MTEHSAEVMAGARAVVTSLIGPLWEILPTVEKNRYCQAFSAGLAAYQCASVDQDEDFFCADQPAPPAAMGDV